MKTMEWIKAIISWVIIYILDVGIAAVLLWLLSFIPVFNVVVTVKAMCIGGGIILILELLWFLWFCYGIFDGLW